MVERIHGMDEASGSIPLRSTGLFFKEEKMKRAILREGEGRLKRASLLKESKNLMRAARKDVGAAWRLIEEGKLVLARARLLRV